MTDMSEIRHSQRARELVHQLLHLGLTQKEVAVRLQTHQSTISRLLSDDDWPVSARLCAAIEVELKKVRETLFEQVFQTPLQVLSYCSDQPNLTSESAERIKEAARRVLSGQPASASALPPGTKSAIVSVGELGKGSYLILCSVTESSDARLLAHELRHMADLLDRSDASKGTEQRKKLQREAF